MHHELLKLHNRVLNTETDPVLLRVEEGVKKITEGRLAIRQTRYEITEHLEALDAADQAFDELLDLAITQRLDRLEELRLGSEHDN